MNDQYLRMQKKGREIWYDINIIYYFYYFSDKSIYIDIYLHMDFVIFIVIVKTYLVFFFIYALDNNITYPKYSIIARFYSDVT